jgi:hypothetical protein
MTLELVDFEQLGESALDDFKQANENDASGASERLVAKVELTYALAAKLAHREQTVEGTGAIWAKMVAICDQIAAQVQRAAANTAALDRILDLRNAAERRRELHS